MTSPIFCQEAKESFSIHSVIVDSINNQVIPFASVYKIRDQKGTLSNYQGAFVIENVLPGDTLLLKNIGFEKKYIIANPFSSYDTIFMNRTAQLLSEVIVIAKNAFLYTLISNAHKIKPLKKTAKTYFELTTFHDQKQLELFQGYYNGVFKGYDVASLDMKNARFALAPISKRIFASTETSKAVYMHELFNKNDYFPTSPFELTSKQLHKIYNLTLSSRYKDETNKTIYVINFRPKKELDQSFEGTVWMDSVSATIIKVTLKIVNAKTYPFLAIWSTDTLKNVCIELTKQYSVTHEDVFVNAIDFNYTLNYKSKTDSTFNISTRAVLNAYNYNDVFELPSFKFQTTSHSDYRLIQILHPNELFWDCNDEFKMESKNTERTHFLNNEATINAYNLFSSDTLIKRNLFEHPYITWSGKRVLFRDNSEDSSRYTLEQSAIPSQRYHLEVQLFMDINEVCDTLQIITKTIFDPFLSFYNFHQTKESQAFINIYFDLIEIERRKLAEELIKCKKDILLMKVKYNEALKNIAIIRKKYFNEIERGSNKTNLKKWNSVVYNALNIDNIYLFNVEL